MRISFPWFKRKDGEKIAVAETSSRKREPSASRRLREEREKAEIALMQAEASSLNQYIAESGQFFDSKAYQWFNPLNFATADAIEESSFQEMQRNAYQAWVQDSYYHGWVELFVKMIAGASTKLIAKDHDTETQEVLDEYCENKRFPDGRRERGFTVRFEEQVRRWVRDGDGIKRQFGNPFNGDIYWRWLDPRWVWRTGRADINDSFGVQTNPNDNEHVLNYVYWPNGVNTMGVYVSRLDYKMIPASEVLHSKNGDSDQKRGRPLLLPVTKDLLELRKLLEVRFKYHDLSRRYAIQRKVTGARDLLKAMHEKNKARTNNDTGLKEAAPDAGSVITTSPGVEIDIKTAMLHAVDADADVRRKLLGIFVGLGITEAVGAGDASNNNYNSGSIAENPFLRTIVWLQGKLAPDVKEEAKLFLESKIRTGMLSPMSFEKVKRVSPNGMDVVVDTNRVRRNTSVEIEFPMVLERDILKETNALAVQHSFGWVDDDSAMTQLGYDPEEIKRRRKVQDIEKIENGDAIQAANMVQQELAGMGVGGGRNGANGARKNGALQTGASSGNGNGSRARTQLAGR